MSGQLVVQDVRIGRHDRVADFDRPAVRVERRTNKPKDWHTGRYLQQSSFSLGRHSRRNFLSEPLQGVPEFLKASIDSPWPWIRVCDWSPTRYFCRKIGCGGFNRCSIKGIAPASNDYRSSMVKTLPHFRRDRYLLDLDQVDVRNRTSLF